MTAPRPAPAKKKPRSGMWPVCSTKTCPAGAMLNFEFAQASVAWCCMIPSLPCELCLSTQYELNLDHKTDSFTVQVFTPPNWSVQWRDGNTFSSPDGRMMQGTPSKRKRAPKTPSALKKPEDLNEIADELCEVAKEIRIYARNMKRLRIERIRPLMGNYTLALRNIKKFVTVQILNRLTVEAAKRGKTIHDIINPPNE